VAAYRPRDCLVTLATGVLGAHVGPGAWAVFYQVEDAGGGRDLDPTEERRSRGEMTRTLRANGRR
jgi:hypothetical protein